MAKGKGKLRLGTSGWQYNHWKGTFYPRELRKNQWFEHYAKTFDTVEINNTFYRLPSEKTFHAWREATPKGFCYALKFSRYGSHMKRLKDPADSIGAFLERAEVLGKLLGPILVQLPPNFKVDADRLDAFLDAAPSRIRWAVEFRHPSWLCKPVYDVLSRRKAALCIHDMIDTHPRKVTADWVYLRFHGSNYGGSYSAQSLSATARRIESHLSDGLDVYVYFNNDVHGYAVANAIDLRRYVLGD